MRDPEQLVLIFGSNMEDRAGNIRQAISLASAAGEEVQRSSLYESDPWGFSADVPFYNQVVVYRTALAPTAVLQLCARVEQQMGRQRDPSTRYASRVIDVDILFHGSRVANLPDLIIPHPRLAARRFVLAPLAELLPSFIHPTLNKSISALLQECPDAGQVRLVP
ncbi:MAG: 2-amino-4-hydroxy-6-hydroxymethyldihydropteridine diphosphokinase [Odoribacteraceae bacterium]|jgi:2-amino-4-hydroxy-6-hydroxymethyldihydropteridine diphosphokinase|nr:2-amino-4-hydroxy-6-hydroxymethyldihydropteridine diphosphokinase [Odoribacteraceae bacterium]